MEKKPLYCKGGETLEQCPGKLSSMPMYKVRLHGTLSNLAEWEISLFMTGELERDAF